MTTLELLGEGAKTIDASNGHDLAIVRRALRERWPIPVEKRRDIAERVAKVAAESNDERSIVAAARVLAQMDGLNQADEHLENKNERLDGGKATERVEGVEFVVPGLNQVPTTRTITDKGE